MNLENQEEEKAYKKWCKNRTELLTKYKDDKNKWQKTLSELIHTFHSCYYKTSYWAINAFENKIESAEYFKLFDLCSELILQMNEEIEPSISVKYG